MLPNSDHRGQPSFVGAYKQTTHSHSHTCVHIHVHLYERTRLYGAFPIALMVRSRVKEINRPCHSKSRQSPGPSTHIEPSNVERKRERGGGEGAEGDG